MPTASRELLSSAVKSFLRALADEEIDYDFKIGYTIEELRKRQSRKAHSVEEMRKLYDACKNRSATERVSEQEISFSCSG